MTTAPAPRARERDAPGLPLGPTCRWPSTSAALLYLAARIGLAGAAAWPAAAAVGALTAAEPDGDRVLWAPGAEVLVDVAARLEPAAPSLATRAGIGLLLGLFVMLVPLAMLLASMRVDAAARAASEPASMKPFLRAAADAAPLALLQGVTLLLQLAAGGLAVFVGALAARSLELGREGQLLSQAVAFGIGALLVWLAGLWQDVARVAVVHHGEGFVGAVGMSLAVGSAGLRRPLVAAAWRAAAVLALSIGGLSAGLQVGGGSGGGGLAVAIHLGVVVAVVALRVSWLRWLGTYVMRWTLGGGR